MIVWIFKKFYLCPLIQDTSRGEEKLQKEKEKLQSQMEALKKAAQVGENKFRPEGGSSSILTVNYFERLHKI